jgi:hypothetical protein
MRAFNSRDNVPLIVIRRREEERERVAEERREQEVRTRGGMPSPHNTNILIIGNAPLILVTLSL